MTAVRALGAVFLLVSLGASAASADVSVRASARPQRAEVGQPISLTIEVNGTQGVAAPALDTLDGFTARYVGPSTQVTFVNGQLSASVQHRYSLVPLRPGRFTLGPFRVEHQGQRYQTEPVTIEVVAAAAPQAPAGAPSGQPASAGTAFRLTLTTSNTEAYVHERLPVDVTLYIAQAARVADIQYPALPGDGLSIDKFPEPDRRQEVVEGQTFDVFRFHTAIVPMRSGTVRLGPATLQVNVLTRRRGSPLNDPFFERFFQDDPFNTERRPVELRSDPLMLTVLPLPEQDKPPGFSGAVGSFRLAVSAAPTEVTAGDPITLHTKITGTGNLTDASAPRLTDPTRFRTYDARAVNTEPATKTFEQVLIPSDVGTTVVPPVEFSYFDPRARGYRTLRSEPITLVVRAPQAPQRPAVVVGGQAPPRPAEELGRDIVFIKDDPGRLVTATDGSYAKLLFLAWQPVPLLLFIAAVWYDRHRTRVTGDVRYARFSRAGKDARRGLAHAATALRAGERSRFYDTLDRTMREYLGAKLDLPPGAIDADAVAGRAIPPDCAESVRRFFEACEHVRFAPSAGVGDMQGALSLAQQILRRLERERSLRPGTVAAVAAWSSVLLLGSIALAQSDAATTPQTAFFHANAAYRDGHYAEAAEEYEHIRASGFASGNVYFNLGNAYFKLGDRGRAILNYERAERLLPRDPDVAANLTYARSLTGAEACRPPRWQRLVFPLAEQLPSRQLGGLLSACFTGLMLALAAYRLSPRRPRWLLYVAVALSVALAVSAASLARQAYAQDWIRAAVVIADGETSARFEPAPSGTVHFALKQGTRVQVNEARDGWTQVTRCDGRRGWVESTSVEPL